MGEMNLRIFVRIFSRSVDGDRMSVVQTWIRTWRRDGNLEKYPLQGGFRLWKLLTKFSWFLLVDGRVGYAGLNSDVLWKQPHEKLPYYNPTQVGKCHCTKVSKEGHLRNSAKSPRKFARRGTKISEGILVAGNRRVRLFTKNTSLRKVERCCMWADACPVLDIERRKWKVSNWRSSKRPR